MACTRRSGVTRDCVRCRSGIVGHVVPQILRGPGVAKWLARGNCVHASACGAGLKMPTRLECSACACRPACMHALIASIEWVVPICGPAVLRSACGWSLSLGDCSLAPWPVALEGIPWNRDGFLREVQSSIRPDRLGIDTNNPIYSTHHAFIHSLPLCTRHTSCATPAPLTFSPTSHTSSRPPLFAPSAVGPCNWWYCSGSSGDGSTRTVTPMRFEPPSHSSS
jgi:hypothetical protein